MKIDWFLGFLEGEGNFSVLFGTKQSRGREYVHIKLIFQIRLGVFESEVIKEIRQFLKEHNIKSKSHLHPPHSRGKAQIDVQVIETESVRKLIQLLNSCKWHTQKLSDFEKWKQCMKIKEESPDLYGKGRKNTDAWRRYIHNLLKINHIAQSMNYAIKRRRWTFRGLIDFLKTHRPYMDFDFVRKLKADEKLEENLRILGIT